MDPAHNLRAQNWLEYIKGVLLQHEAQMAAVEAQQAAKTNGQALAMLTAQVQHITTMVTPASAPALTAPPAPSHRPQGGLRSDTTGISNPVVHSLLTGPCYSLCSLVRSLQKLPKWRL